MRLLIFKADGSVMVHADTGGFKPQNWMTPPTVIEEEGDRPSRAIVVRKTKGEDRLDIRIAEILTDIAHEHGRAAALEKEGVERGAAGGARRRPGARRAQVLRLVRREWPTDIGPVDLMCRDASDGWVAVEIKRIGTIDAVEQLTRYLERLREDAALSGAAGSSQPSSSSPRRARSPRARGIAWVEVDLTVLRGEREPDLTLFAD